ncbi:MAG: hypothetical protein AAF648_01385 [Pseudomonadota bacterium]
MNDTAPTRRPIRWVRWLLLSIALATVVGYASFRYAQAKSDGPLNDIVPGGALRSGPLTETAVRSWTAELARLNVCATEVCGDMQPIEVQLESPARSRYVGVMLHRDELYIPCDLGFMWQRFAGTERRMLELIYHLKTWHEDAVANGSAKIRFGGVGGTRYAVTLEQVTDASLIDSLKSQLEAMAAVWVAPAPLAPAPATAPNDIWFFKVLPR